MLNCMEEEDKDRKASNKSVKIDDIINRVDHKEFSELMEGLMIEPQYQVKILVQSSGINFVLSVYSPPIYYTFKTSPFSFIPIEYYSFIYNIITDLIIVCNMISFQISY